MTNCDLIPLDDMFKNGTVINDKQIKTPKSLSVAMTLATQIITKVASFTYGGCTITLTHLAPFVRESYNRHLSKYIKRGLDEETSVNYAKEDLKKEVNDSVQTFNYQVNSMTTTNGQSPFLSVFMYLGESKEYKEELALLIEEFFNQRIVGFKNEKGVSIIDFLNNYSINKAKELLIEGAMPLNDISEMIGFSSYNYFSRLFKKKTGYSPKEYRRIIK